MRRNGLTFNRAYHLGYRIAGEGDTDYRGCPVSPGFVVIVKISNCKIDEGLDGVRTYNATGVKGIPVVYSQSNMAYGKRRYQEAYGYWTCPVYWVENGMVYHGTTGHRTEEPVCRCGLQTSEVNVRCDRCGAIVPSAKKEAS